MKTRTLGAVLAAATFALAILISPANGRAGDSADVVASPDATITLSNFQAASVVIGQTGFSGSLPNQGLSGPEADTDTTGFGSIGLGPTGVLYLADYSNQRVLGFNSVPSSNDAGADFVLGQPNLTSTGKGDAANQFGGPQSPFVFNQMLFVSDFFNNRVLIWKKAPTSDQAPADIVLGQAGFGTNNTSCTVNGLSAPETLAVGGGKLVVADSSNARVLIYKKIPKKSGQKPNIVLGQNNFTTCVTLNNGHGVSGSPSAANLSYPAGVWTDGKRLVVTDEDLSRVLIWKTFPKKNFQKADIVLGQPGFTSSVVNNNGTNGSGPPSASNMNMPYDGVFSNGTQLFVDDQKNERILVWNTFPTANFAPADVVLGQPSFSCGVSDNDGSGCVHGAPSADNLNEPTGIFQVGNQLIVSDGGNNRFLIYNGM